MATRTISFRCPDDLLAAIERAASKADVDKTTVIVEALKSWFSTVGEDEFKAVLQPNDDVRQVVNEAIATLRQEFLSQIDEIRGELPALVSSPNH